MPSSSLCRPSRCVVDGCARHTVAVVIVVVIVACRAVARPDVVVAVVDNAVTVVVVADIAVVIVVVARRAVAISVVVPFSPLII